MTSSTFTRYTTIEFLLDEDFRNWLKGNMPVSEAWERFLREDASRNGHFEEAVRIAKLVENDGYPASPAVQSRTWEALLRRKETGRWPAEAAVVRMGSYWRKAAIAAAVLLVMAGAAWMGGLFEKKADPSLTAKIVNDAQPGSDKATLMLENGKVIALDDTSAGNLATGSPVRVIKTGGMLTYELAGIPGQAAAGAPAWHLLSTPRGGQFSLVLPDGTRVWLNASSSIRFPSSFTTGERRVEITGEAYFEVAKAPSAATPFRVQLNNAEVEVLGTSFNIMAYNNEPAIRTTLLKGAVKIQSQGKEAILKPGQQAVLQPDNMKVWSDVDLETVVSWKSGVFRFNGTRLPEVMRQLERWYDVNVQYAGKMPEGTLTGEFSRGLMLSEVLKILELSGVDYKIDNKNLIISSK